MTAGITSRGVRGARRKLRVLADLCRIAHVKYRLKTIGFSSTLARSGLALERRRGDRRAPDPRVAESWSARLAVLHQACRRWPGRVSCLERALVLGAALPPGAARLAIGVARRDGGVAAHAWLEVEGGGLEVTPEGRDVELAPLWR